MALCVAFHPHMQLFWVRKYFIFSESFPNISLESELNS